jgi:hypothetical protein
MNNGKLGAPIQIDFRSKGLVAKLDILSLVKKNKVKANDSIADLNFQDSVGNGNSEQKNEDSNTDEKSIVVDDLMNESILISSPNELENTKSSVLDENSVLKSYWDCFKIVKELFYDSNENYDNIAKKIFCVSLYDSNDQKESFLEELIPKHYYEFAKITFNLRIQAETADVSVSKRDELCSKIQEIHQVTMKTLKEKYEIFQKETSLVETFCNDLENISSLWNLESCKNDVHFYENLELRFIKQSHVGKVTIFMEDWVKVKKNLSIELEAFESTAKIMCSDIDLNFKCFEQLRIEEQRILVELKLAVSQLYSECIEIKETLGKHCKYKLLSLRKRINWLSSKIRMIQWNEKLCTFIYELVVTTSNLAESKLLALQNFNSITEKVKKLSSDYEKLLNRLKNEVITQEEFDSKNQFQTLQDFLKEKFQSMLTLFEMSSFLPEISYACKDHIPSLGTCFESYELRSLETDYRNLEIYNANSDNLKGFSIKSNQVCVLKKYNLRNGKELANMLDILGKSQIFEILSANAIALSFDYSNRNIIFVEFSCLDNQRLSDLLVNEELSKTGFHADLALKQLARIIQNLHYFGVLNLSMSSHDMFLHENGSISYLRCISSSDSEKENISYKKYLDPEVALHGLHKFNAKSDLYTLGVIYAELLTLKPYSFDKEIEDIENLPQEAKQLLKGLLNPFQEQRIDFEQLWKSDYFKRNRVCMIHGESFDSELFASAGGHHFCQNCFDCIVESFCSSKEASRDMHLDHLIPCPSDSANEFFSFESVCGIISQKSLETFKNWISKVQDPSEDFKSRISILHEINHLNDADRFIACFKKEIQELVKPKCPSCYSLVELGEISAQRCFECGSDFCGWCMQSFSKDLFGHIAKCAFNITPRKSFWCGPLVKDLFTFFAKRKIWNKMLLIQDPFIYSSIKSFLQDSKLLFH